MLSLTIARTTFIEALRQPVFFVLVMLALLGTLLTTWSTGFSMGYTDTSEVSGDNKLMLDVGMSGVLLVGTILGGFIATGTFTREIENKTVLTIVSKPVPRFAVVLGKWLGAIAAAMVGVVIMVVGLLMGVRHGVMWAAWVELDTVVVSFSVGAVLVSLLVGAWGNFFYGWSFTQTAMLVLCPLSVVAYALVLAISPKWAWQNPMADFKPQVLTAALCLVLALGVMTSVAVALSTRLGQVMTITLCVGVFVLGLLSSTVLGPRAYIASPIAEVLEAQPVDPAHASLTRFGDQYRLTLKSAGGVSVRPGASIYYGPNPNGLDVQVPAFAPSRADASVEQLTRGEGGAGLYVLGTSEGNIVTVQNTSREGLRPGRPPAPGDFVFLEPVRSNPAARLAWGVVPNVQFFWLMDAVGQNSPVPVSHLLLLVLYAGAQIAAYLAGAVLLFQGRDVG